MDLTELQRHWDTFGRRDPFWAILTDPSRRGNRWQAGEFFETGRMEVAALLEHAARLGVPHVRRRALDFGCGAGRLTQALADRFAHVDGLDVAPSMIDLARAHNRHGPRCQYHVNEAPDLGRWPDASVDLVYTSRVLQHIEPDYACGYIREFVRVLAPGGYLSFDVPSVSGDAAALADGTVPASAMRARLDVIRPESRHLEPVASDRYHVRVTNLSERTWHATDAHPINVGNHWLAADGSLLRQDDARAVLQTPLAPGQQAAVEILVMPPPDPGRYRLQFDVVQEGVAWFASCGSQVSEIEVTVAADQRENRPAAARAEGDVPGPSPEADPGFEPVMEMHAVPRQDVEALLAGAGGRLLDVRRVYHCGPQWLAFRYDVTRTEAPAGHQA